MSKATEALAAAISAAWPDTPFCIILALISMASTMAPEPKITGRKKMARTRALPGNFLFNSIAMNKLKKVINGTSTSMFITEDVNVCLKVPCSRKAYR